MARSETIDSDNIQVHRKGISARNYRLLGAGMLLTAALLSSRIGTVGFVASKRVVSEFGVSAYFAAGDIDKTRQLYPPYIPNLLYNPHFLSIMPRLDVTPIQIGLEVDIVSFEAIGVLTFGDHLGLQEEVRPISR
jgi:hypothetical protein